MIYSPRTHYGRNEEFMEINGNLELDTELVRKMNKRNLFRFTREDKGMRVTSDKTTFSSPLTLLSAEATATFTSHECCLL